MKNLSSVIEGILDAKSADDGIASEISKSFPKLITKGLDYCQFDYKNGVLTIDCEDVNHCGNSERKYKIFREQVDKNFWKLVKTLNVDSYKFMFGEYERNWVGGVNAPKTIKILHKGPIARGANGSFMTISSASNITIDCSVNKEFSKTAIYLNYPVFSNIVVKGEYLSFCFELGLPPESWDRGLKGPDATHISISVDCNDSTYKILWESWLNDWDTILKPFPKAKSLYISLNFKSRLFKKEGNKWVER